MTVCESDSRRSQRAVCSSLRRSYPPSFWKVTAHQSRRVPVARIAVSARHEAGGAGRRRAFERRCTRVSASSRPAARRCNVARTYDWCSSVPVHTEPNRSGRAPRWGRTRRPIHRFDAVEGHIQLCYAVLSKLPTFMRPTSAGETPCKHDDQLSLPSSQLGDAPLTLYEAVSSSRRTTGAAVALGGPPTTLSGELPAGVGAGVVSGAFSRGLALAHSLLQQIPALTRRAAKGAPVGMISRVVDVGAGEDSPSSWNERRARAL